MNNIEETIHLELANTDLAVRNYKKDNSHLYRTSLESCINKLNILLIEYNGSMKSTYEYMLNNYSSYLK